MSAGRDWNTVCGKMTRNDEEKQKTRRAEKTIRFSGLYMIQIVQIVEIVRYNVDYVLDTWERRVK